ncbi:MAG TPA: porphobilinogen synthase [Planctomycetota bacterium]|nr:porphobilinogen synthase [Planctomycetota bacterium]
MTFPTHRMRRLRGQRWGREMARETRLHPSMLVEPFFVKEGESRRDPVSAMPGVFQLSIDTLVEECGRSLELGIGAVILFGLPASKDAAGTSGYAPHGIVPRAIRALKESLPDVYVMADVCLCEYTDHGHCGLLPGGAEIAGGKGIAGDASGAVLNDETLELLARESVAYAEAGADMVAPSAMMDGQVGAIRKALDGAGFSSLPIMSYAAKYASGFYGPFREAARSAPRSGDRSAYQMDPSNAREALREVDLDLEEGADIILVKPALSYLDILRRVAERSNVPVAAYNVSGEYSMVKAAAERGWIDGQRVLMEILTSIRRAGADIIITYHAREAAAAFRG